MSPQIRRTRSTLVAAAIALAAVPFATLSAAPAQAGQGSGNPILVTTPSKDLAVSGPTTLTVKGTDYLVPPHAAGTPVTGGIYVFFGYVDSAKKWGPSGRNVENTDGNFGTTYFYPGEQGGQDTRDDSGGIGFVAFTPGEEGATSMDDNGNWETTVKVAGPTFSTSLPGSGKKKDFDCRVVTCGVFTIGAHGKASATNEKFAPVKFTGAGSASPTPTPTATPKVSANSNSDPDAPGDTDDSANPAVSPLPKTGIDNGSSSASVVRPLTPLDGQTVAIGVRDAQDTGTGGGLALFGVAALAALVMALTVSLFLRFRREGPQA